MNDFIKLDPYLVISSATIKLIDELIKRGCIIIASDKQKEDIRNHDAAMMYLNGGFTAQSSMFEDICKLHEGKHIQE